MRKALANAFDGLINDDEMVKAIAAFARGTDLAIADLAVDDVTVVLAHPGRWSHNGRSSCCCSGEMRSIPSQFSAALIASFGNLGGGQSLQCCSIDCARFEPI